MAATNNNKITKLRAASRSNGKDRVDAKNLYKIPHQLEQKGSHDTQCVWLAACKWFTSKILKTQR